MIRGLVVDIDDTLYLERDYVRSGFAAVARDVGRSHAEVDRLRAWLWAAFEDGARGDTFDRARAAFPEMGARVTTADLVAAYQAHVPAIALADGTRELLDRLRDGGLRLGVLSDGPVASQSAKAAALGLDRWFDPIVLTGAFEPAYAKPGTAGFLAIAAAWRLGPEDLAYVADNPAKDFAGPRRLGWTTIRLSRPGQLHRDAQPIDADHRPDLVINDFGYLPHVLMLPAHEGS